MSKLSLDILEREVKAAPERMPRHIAFIMDGNGRWAKQRNKPRVFGHNEGVKSVRTMVETGVELGVEVMTFYTFSQENWKRPAQEVSALMSLLVSTIRREVADLDKNNVRLKMIGNTEDLPEKPRAELEAAQTALAKNDGLLLVLALSYGSRGEILQAVNRLLAEGKSEITEEELSAALDTGGLPDPDLLIRTSGEFRLSNFLLWQSAYTELYVTDIYWPDFRKRELLEAIHEYQGRERRFGATSEQVAKPEGNGS